VCFWAVLVLSSECPLFGLIAFDFRFYDLSMMISFHNLTNADAFLSSILTLRLFDYLSIPLDSMT
jgi:hypothetical protein